MTADLLDQILREASTDERGRDAQRLSNLTEPPSVLARILLRDAIEVARPLIELCSALSDADLLDCAKNATIFHRIAIAARRELSELVCEALVERMEAPVIEVVLRNESAKLAANALEILVAATREHPRTIPALLRRPEVRPAHAYILFWWADADARRAILQRFAVSREVLQEAASDVFSVAAAENWADPLSRKALQFIERQPAQPRGDRQQPVRKPRGRGRRGAGGLEPRDRGGNLVPLPA